MAEMSFALILPDTNFEGGRRLASRIASRLANDSEEGPVLSFCHGVAIYPNDGDSLQKLLAVADVAMYAMKRLGHALDKAHGETAR